MPDFLVILPARFCRACGAPNPFLTMPICPVCLALSMWRWEQLMERMS
jgi:hypothetical protein